VHDVTEGNPFFVGEVVAALGGNGDPGTALTPRVRDVVRWRLARLPDGTGHVLDAAAVAGAEFDADVLADVVEVDLESALDALEAAEQARLIRSTSALDRFSFAHALVRQTIVDELPAGRRVRLHARIARALELAAKRGPSRSVTWRPTSRPPERSSTPAGQCATRARRATRPRRSWPSTSPHSSTSVPCARRKGSPT
jgi:hypothetical protein